MNDTDRVVQDDSEINVIFIHSSLDDIGLTANQFRIFAHLARRAHSEGKAWPGIDSIAKVCRMNKDTVIQCLRDLEDRKMIVTDKAPGRRTVYRLTAPSKWIPSESRERSYRPNQGNAPSETEERHRPNPGNVRISSEGNPKRTTSIKSKLAPSDGSEDEEWLGLLSLDAAYSHLDIKIEFSKMVRWCEVNGKQPTRRRFINWINRIEKPLNAKTKSIPSTYQRGGGSRNEGTYNEGKSSDYKGFQRTS